jgi:homoserine acetyltransferase
MMKPIKNYSTRIEADVAKIALDALGIRSVVVGVGASMEGGTGGVQLLVEDDRFKKAQKVLGAA